MLLSGKKYSIITRVKETETTKASAASDPLSVTTLTAAAQEEKNTLVLNSKFKVTQTKKKITVEWASVPGADRYRVYAEYCGKFKPEKVADVDSKTTKIMFKKLHGKKLNLKKNYKIYVVAQKGKKKFVHPFERPWALLG